MPAQQLASRSPMCTESVLDCAAQYAPLGQGLQTTVLLSLAYVPAAQGWQASASAAE